MAEQIETDRQPAVQDFLHDLHGNLCRLEVFFAGR